MSFIILKSCNNEFPVNDPNLAYESVSIDIDENAPLDCQYLIEFKVGKYISMVTIHGDPGLRYPLFPQDTGKPWYGKYTDSTTDKPAYIKVTAYRYENRQMKYDKIPVSLVLTTTRIAIPPTNQEYSILNKTVPYTPGRVWYSADTLHVQDCKIFLPDNIV